MKTIISRIQHNSEDSIVYEKASQILKEGGLVAFPTETVYGLGADALDEAASAKIYSAKGRPSDNPLIVHIADTDALYDLSCQVNERALKLADKFWPGPLTMILKKSPKVPDSITGGLDTVAIRMPSHPVASRLIKESGVYIAAPSANISGKPSPTTGEHVIHDMDGRIDMIICDDASKIGVESTIVDISGRVPILLRPGFITIEQLRETLGQVEIDPAIQNGLAKGVVPRAPGMKYKHYSPNAEVTIVSGQPAQVEEKINSLVLEKKALGFKTGVLCNTEDFDKYSADLVIDLGSKTDEAGEARQLFAALRRLDQEGIDFAYSEEFTSHDVGAAVMNRLVKAAGHKIIHV